MITFLLFIDDLGFIILGSLVKKIVKIFETIAKAILNWKKLNIVTNNTLKIEIVLFSQLHC